MDNFLNFIEEDIEAKKTLLATLPTKTKVNKKAYNQKIDLIQKKYESYKDSVKKYINAKNKKFSIKHVNKNLDELSNEVANLEHVRFVLNPMNTYYEKMGFDNLIFQINHYADFRFSSLNKIINTYLDKFELINVYLTDKDFDYTCYVNEYMKDFLDVRYKKQNNYEKVSKTFERVYWLNPDLIQHIELNFRKLIKNYSSKFEKYILSLQKKLKAENGIKDYEDCIEKLKKAYIKLNKTEEENINDILILARTNEIDINDYMPDSKMRTQIYSTISLDTLNFNDEKSMDDFYKTIYKLRSNVVEYNNYREFIPLMLDFKKEYESLLSSDYKTVSQKLKEIEKEINEKEKKLNGINKKIFGLGLYKFKKIDKTEEKNLKSSSVNISKELYKLYKDYDCEYFKSFVSKYLNKNYTISDFLNLYYSFDYFKKNAIKKVFEINNFEELIKIADNFDLFAMNLTNVVMEGTSLFENDDVSQTIVNKYRLSKINIQDEDLNTNNIENLLKKLDLLLRINKIEKSETTVEKMWFLIQVEKMNMEQ